MTNDVQSGLLPAGLHDGLPPEALAEADTISALMACYQSWGYERIKPPLVEFEESLLTGPGAALAPHLFRLMDPISQRMMGVRADITPQIARIVSTRMRGSPRPLRLCYAGDVLRIRGSQLRPERQFAQAGLELVGASTLAADVEIVLLAATGLAAAGVADLSIDLTVPTLVPAICADLGLDDAMARDVRYALDRKDRGALKQSGAGDHAVFDLLLEVTGPAEPGIERLKAVDLGPAGNRMVTRLDDLVQLVRASAPEIKMTVDPGEFRGFEYQTGISFSIFARNVRGELGRGGRYAIATGEDAIGFTIYLDSVLRGLPESEKRQRIYIPYDETAAGTDLRAAGWITVAGLEPTDRPDVEARRQNCSHIYCTSGIQPLDQK